LSARACAAARAARARARRARRAAAVDVVVFFAGSVAGVDFAAGAAVVCRLDDAWDAVAVWADVTTGSAAAVETASAQISRAFQNSRARITGNPLRNNLLGGVSAL